MILVSPSCRFGDHIVGPERKPPLGNFSFSSASEQSQLVKLVSLMSSANDQVRRGFANLVKGCNALMIGSSDMVDGGGVSEIALKGVKLVSPVDVCSHRAIHAPLDNSRHGAPQVCGALAKWHTRTGLLRDGLPCFCKCIRLNSYRIHSHAMVTARHHSRQRSGQGQCVPVSLRTSLLPSARTHAVVDMTRLTGSVPGQLPERGFGFSPKKLDYIQQKVMW